MRYSTDHKQATRQRILEAAGRRFKQDGIDGAGVAAVMSDAGLTNGAFYAHFASKEDLVANVLADQLRAQRQSFDAPDRGGLEAFIRSYLSPQHRDQCADGCPSAALLDEIARRPAATKQVFTDELMGVIDDIASRLDPTDAEAARADALTLFGLMLGTLQLAWAAHRPRPVRSAPRPGRRDGHEAAERPGMTPLQTARALQCTFALYSHVIPSARRAPADA
jgi:TetR/AcrR family transcriptional repressor of nem operon